MADPTGLLTLARLLSLSDLVLLDPVFLNDKMDRGVARQQVERRIGRSARELLVLCPANDKRNDLAYVEPLLVGLRDAAVARDALVLVLCST